jgi:hypothetical protein
MPRQTKYEETVLPPMIKYSGKILIYSNPEWDVLFPVVDIIRKLPENTIINHVYTKNQNNIKMYSTQYNHLVIGIDLKTKNDYSNLRTVKFIFIFSDKSDTLADNLINYSKKTKTPLICYSMIDSVYHFYFEESKIQYKTPEEVIEQMEIIKQIESTYKFDELFPELEILDLPECKKSTLEECMVILKKKKDEINSKKNYSTKIPFDPNFSKLKYLEKEKENKKIVYGDEHLTQKRNISSFFKKK